MWLIFIKCESIGDLKLVNVTELLQEYSVHITQKFGELATHFELDYQYLLITVFFAVAVIIFESLLAITKLHKIFVCWNKWLYQIKIPIKARLSMQQNCRLPISDCNFFRRTDYFILWCVTKGFFEAPFWIWLRNLSALIKDIHSDTHWASH